MNKINKTQQCTGFCGDIIPHSEFKYISMECEEFKRCWALKNLRPLSAKLNLLDGVKRIRHTTNTNEELK